MIDHIVIIGFALFLYTGAFFGFKAGSKISLIMGLVSGTMILAGDVLKNYNARSGELFLMAVAGLLIVSFVQRLLKTKKMMPSGMLLLISSLFFAFMILKFYN